MTTLYRIEIEHMDGSWNEAAKQAKFVDGKFVYPRYNTHAQAEAAIAADYADVLPGSVRIIAEAPATILVSIGRGRDYRVHTNGEVEVIYWANAPRLGTERRRSRRIDTFGMTARLCRAAARQKGFKVDLLSLMPKD